MESCRCPISCREIFGKRWPRPSPWLAATPDGRGTARAAGERRFRSYGGVQLVQVPVAVCRDPSSLRIELRERDGRPYEVYHFTYGVYDIWGATARIIKHLVDLVGRE